MSKINFLIEEITLNLSELKLLRGEYRRKWLIALFSAWWNQVCFNDWQQTKNNLKWKIKELIKETEDLQSSLEKEVNILEDQRGN